MCTRAFFLNFLCVFHTEKVGAARSLSIIMLNKFYFIDHISLSSLKVDRSVDWSIAPLFVSLCIEMFIFALFISFHLLVDLLFETQ